MFKILDATTQKFIHLGDKACGLDNIALLNKNERGSEEQVNHWNLIINLIEAPCIFAESLQFINQRMHI